MSETSDTPITRLAGRGAAWVTGASFFGLLAGFVAQVILGWILVDRDFGLYALALTVSIAFQVIKDGGVGLYLAKESPERFRRLSGDAIWLGLMVGAASGAAVIGLAPVFGALYDEPDLPLLLLVIGLSLPLAAYPSVASASLKVHLRFSTLAPISAFTSVLRQVLMVGFALAGLGPMSFVLPIPIVAIIHTVILAFVTRIRLPRPTGLAGPLAIIKQTRWALAGSLAEYTAARADYLMLGLVVSVETLGVYFFAFELTDKLRVLFSSAMGPVLLPSLARRTDHATRWKAGIIASVGLVALLSAAPAALLSGSASLLEQLLWRGRWEAAVVPISLLAVVVPFSLATTTLRVGLQSTGRFRAWTATLAVKAFTLAVAALVVGVAVGSKGAGWIAAGISLYMVLFAVGEAYWLTRRLAIPLRSIAVQFSNPLGGALFSMLPAFGAGLISSQASVPVQLAAMGSVFLVSYAVVLSWQLRTVLSATAPYLAAIPVLGRLAGPRTSKFDAT